ncbi:hypothetical protein P3W45_001468 [Vairimorpha bombi]
MNDQIFRYIKKEDNYYISPPYTKYLENDPNKETKIDDNSLDQLICKLLTEKNIKVEEYTNDILTKEGYPGNWKDFTDVCLNKKLPPSLCAIKISKNIVDICFIKTTENILYKCLIEDDDVFSNLYTLLAEINTYEILYDDPKLEFILSMGILTHLCDRSTSSVDLIQKFLKVSDIPIQEYKRPNICTLDNNILESLNIYSNEKCVLDLFHCHTVQGTRLLIQFMKQPLRNKEEIEARLDIIEEIRNINLDLLRGYPDLYKITRKISNMKISVQEIIKIHQIVNKIPNLLDKLKTEKDKLNNGRINNDFYAPLCNIYTNLQKVVFDIERVIDIKSSIRHTIKFNTGCAKISELYDSLDKINKECTDEYKRMTEICDKIKYEEDNEVFRITRIEYKNNEGLLKKHNILVLSILKNGVNFTTKKLAELNLERNKLKECINRETAQILNELRNGLKKFVNEFEILNYITALLDVFNAFGLKSRDPGYTRPIFGDKLIIKEGFHPLLEDKDYIGNDIELGYKKMCIITGPNMGGKSTFLKMVGVISVLAQVGCYVPAKYAEVPIYDGIFIRIGANDCSIKGCSTFMVEMKDISRICRMSTKQSLVLIDELGRGTSEIDGLSIAKAVKDHLFKLGCHTIFATHFPELCDERGVNKKALNDKLTLLYKIVDGICDTSFGYNVAELVGFPEDVLKNIKNMMEQ